MKSIIVGLVAVSMFISACNDSASTEEGKESILGQSKNMLDAEIDYFGGDLHQILELDTAALIDKYTVFSLELMLPRPNENGAYTRTISLMKGLQSVSEKELAYYGSDPSEMQKVAQATFDAFSQQHGKLAAPAKTTYLQPMDGGSSQIKQDTFTYLEKENGYTVTLGLQSSRTGKFYELTTYKSHQKYE